MAPLAPTVARMWMRSLDAFRRCTCPGCEWCVRSDDDEARCADHGGGPNPQYLPDPEGAFVAVRFIVPDTDDE